MLNPARVKIDHVVHLQDARYVAAAGVGFMTLCLERGHLRKLSESAAWELLDWLHGPQFILDFGLDYKAAEAYVRSPTRTDVWVQLACPIDMLEIHALPPAHIVSIGFDSMDKLRNNRNWIEQLVQDDYRIELAPQREFRDQNELFDMLSIVEDTFFIQIDQLNEIALVELGKLSVNLSLRHLVEADTFSLDYDRFEKLIVNISEEA